MAGIYIHIPFCEKKCSYCDFHFSTNLNYKKEMVEALNMELILRQSEINEPIETIYFGGGTPSVLTENELNSILETIYKHFQVHAKEITLEANPDDLHPKKLKELQKSPVNRLSIGIQSFYDEDLQLMNRIHNGHEAEFAIKSAQDHQFENITIDLIYGAPTTTIGRWTNNVEKAISLNVPHISAYALTVEPKTLLYHQIKKNIIPKIDENVQAKEFEILQSLLIENEFIHYEISNFGKPDYFSQHNTAYWKGKKYLGIGPSAHSFNGHQRMWNLANNSKYIQKINQNKLPLEFENLSENDRFNEYIMLGLRTIWGIDLNKLQSEYPAKMFDTLMKETTEFLNNGSLQMRDNTLYIPQEKRFFSDGIAAALFQV